MALETDQGGQQAEKKPGWQKSLEAGRIGPF
jgi:hypothetical protein